MPVTSFGGSPDALPIVEAVGASSDGGWLLGGVVVSGPATTGHFFSTSSEEKVAMWSASSPSGPWRPSTLIADPGRDGPNETIKYIAAADDRAFAFGWRNSPTEGYPRPSPWIQSPVPAGAWREVVKPREFFGGPNIIAFGGASVGPDGYFVSGTWTAPDGPTVASVWHSADGQNWVHDSTDPSFRGRPGEIPFGTGVSDSTLGAVLIGTSDIPTHQDPTARRGAMWTSSHGSAWHRAFTDLIDRSWPRSTFDAVVATSDGWLIAGTTGPVGATRPAVWTVGPSMDHLRAALLPAQSSPVAVTAMAADDSKVIVAGVSDGQPVLWAAPLRDGRVGAWRRLDPPAGSGLDRVVVSVGRTGTIVSLVTNRASSVWTTTWH